MNDYEELIESEESMAKPEVSAPTMDELGNPNHEVELGNVRRYLGTVDDIPETTIGSSYEVLFAYLKGRIH